MWTVVSDISAKVCVSRCHDPPLSSSTKLHWIVLRFCLASTFWRRWFHDICRKRFERSLSVWPSLFVLNESPSINSPVPSLVCMFKGKDHCRPHLHHHTQSLGFSPAWDLGNRYDLALAPGWSIRSDRWILQTNDSCLLCGHSHQASISGFCFVCDEVSLDKHCPPQLWYSRPSRWEFVEGRIQVDWAWWFWFLLVDELGTRK